MAASMLPKTSWERTPARQCRAQGTRRHDGTRLVPVNGVPVYLWLGDIWAGLGDLIPAFDILFQSRNYFVSVLEGNQPFIFRFALVLVQLGEAPGDVLKGCAVEVPDDSEIHLCF